MQLDAERSIAIWKVLLGPDIATVTPQILKQRLQSLRSDAGVWCVLLSRGGHFAGAIFECSRKVQRKADSNLDTSSLFTILAHKTFHRYVVRYSPGRKSPTLMLKFGPLTGCKIAQLWSGKGGHLEKTIQCASAIEVYLFSCFSRTNTTNIITSHVSIFTLWLKIIIVWSTTICRVVLVEITPDYYRLARQVRASFNPMSSFHIQTHSYTQGEPWVVELCIGGNDISQLQNILNTSSNACNNFAGQKRGANNRARTPLANLPSQQDLRSGVIMRLVSCLSFSWTHDVFDK